MIGQKIKYFRKQKNMTQLQLANKIGSLEVCVCRWEKGHNTPNLCNILKLAQALGVNVNQLC